MNRTLSAIFGSYALIIFYNFAPDFYQDIRVHTRYQEARCEVLSKHILPDLPSYKPLVQVSYQVKNKLYQSWVPASRIHATTKTNFDGTKLLNRYQVGTVISCWYDPFDPDVIVLERNYHVSEAAALFMTSFFFMLCVLAGRLNRDKISALIVNNNFPGSWEIKHTFFTVEYIYHGERPITQDQLPEKFRNRSWKIKNFVVNTINENGKFVGLNAYFGYLTLILMSAVLLMFLIVLEIYGM